MNVEESIWLHTFNHNDQENEELGKIIENARDEQKPQIQTICYYYLILISFTEADFLNFFFCPNSSNFYVDLAVINDQADADSLYLESYVAWVNLRKSGLLARWTWPDGQNVNLSHWAGIPSLLLGDSCAYINFIDKR